MDRGADSAALDRRVAGAVVAGDQKEDPLAGRDRPLERAVDCPPRRVEVHSVEVEHSVGLDRAAAQPPVPAAVEGGAI